VLPLVDIGSIAVIIGGSIMVISDTQFLLAIYTPAVWNYLYGLLQNFLPVV
jgi:hypothetical protein